MLHICYVGQANWTICLQECYKYENRMKVASNNEYN